MNKGTFSNILSAIVLAVGWLLASREVMGGDLLLEAGLFAFSGGITNALAVKMLFDRIPGLYGSGVILDRFDELRREIKRLIVENFFSEKYIRSFVERHRGTLDWERYLDFEKARRVVVERFVEKNWDRFLSPENVKVLIRGQVDRLLSSPVGGLLQMVGRSTIEGIVHNFVQSFAAEMKGKVLEAAHSYEFEPGSLGVGIHVDAIVDDMQSRVDELIEERLQAMRPEDVKRMMEDVIRNHLGWLVVWGNVFGGLIGVAAYYLR